MKYLQLLLLFTLLKAPLMGQMPKDSIDALINKALYMGADQKDALQKIALEIREHAEGIGYTQGAIYYYRFKGWVAEYDSDYEAAIGHYLTFLKKARKNRFLSEELQALGDLGAVYISTEQVEAAQRVFLEGLNKTDSSANPSKKSAFYNNLGITYKLQGKLVEALDAYSKSMRIKEELKDSSSIANLKINTSALLIQLGRYNEAEKQINENITYFRSAKKDADLWHNLTNLAEIKTKLKKYVAARKLADEAMLISKRLTSKKRIAETHFLLSLIEEGENNYEGALYHQRLGNEIKQAFLNEESNNQINKLREEFNAEQRELENAQLSTELDIERQRKLYLIIGSCVLLILLGVIALAYRKNAKKNLQLTHQNQLINLQKSKLIELNEEKNNLISVVSHDLRSPFNSIQLWTVSLIDNLEKSPKKVAEAATYIQKIATYGEDLINNILDIEQVNLNNHKLDLTNIHLPSLLSELIRDFEPVSKRKQIIINLENRLKRESLLSDALLLRRACENLISNALKYSFHGGKVTVRLMESGEKTVIKVEDQGVGIPEESQDKLFQKYAKINSKPTQSESGTGLGLAIVKRIMDELGGNVKFKSKEAKGSIFWLELT